MASSVCLHNCPRVADLYLHISKLTTVFTISGQPVRHVECLGVAEVAQITKLLTLKAPIGPSAVGRFDQELSVLAHASGL